MAARPLAAFIAAYIAAVRDYSQHLAGCHGCTRTIHCPDGSRCHTAYLRTQAAYRTARDHHHS